MARLVGLATIWFSVILALGSMRLPPVYDGPDFPSWWKPAAVSEVMPKYQDWNCPPEYLKWLVRYCSEGPAPVWLVARMFSAESSPTGSPTDGRWSNRATSWMGAIGIAQIMPFNLLDPLFIAFNDGKLIDARDPETAIRVGIRYLTWLHGQLGRWQWAVEAYNVGPRAWLRARTFSDLPAETQGYSKEIMGRSG